MTPANFDKLSDGDNFKLVFYPTAENAKPKQLINKLNKALKKVDFEADVIVDKYLPSQKFVVVKNLISKQGADGLAKKLKKEGLKLVKYNYFSISQKNYNVIQIHKNLDKYLNNA
jgi:hypothetical protein